MYKVKPFKGFDLRDVQVPEKMYRVAPISVLLRSAEPAAPAGADQPLEQLNERMAELLIAEQCALLAEIDRLIENIREAKPPKPAGQPTPAGQPAQASEPTPAPTRVAGFTERTSLQLDLHSPLYKAIELVRPWLPVRVFLHSSAARSSDVAAGQRWRTLANQPELSAGVGVDLIVKQTAGTPPTLFAAAEPVAEPVTGALPSFRRLLRLLSIAKPAEAKCLFAGQDATRVDQLLDQLQQAWLAKTPVDGVVGAQPQEIRQLPVVQLAVELAGCSSS